MPRFAANLSMLFTEHPLDARFAAARAAGFRAVEMLFPYATPAADLRAWMDRSGLRMVLINTPAPDWDAGGRGCAARPGQQARFRAEFETALHYARVLEAGCIHVMSGCAAGPEAETALIANLRWAAARAPDLQLTIEPINPHDMPGYFLNDFNTTARVLDAAGRPGPGLQFDAYHAHHITGDVMGAWAQHGYRAVHVQVAGVPGRHEPVGGVIDYPAFFARLDADGYAGHVAGEYRPVCNTTENLAWAQLRTT